MCVSTRRCKSIANTLIAGNDYERAATLLAVAVEHRPDDGDGNALYSVAMARLGRIEQAIVHDGEALRLNPQFADAHFALGMLLERCGRHAEAVAHDQAVVKIDSKHPAADRLADLTCELTARTH
jgi:tetratricopeptide (TPR) repeat protein